jgi:hypothetical protein
MAWFLSVVEKAGRHDLDIVSRAEKHPPLNYAIELAFEHLPEIVIS